MRRNYRNNNHSRRKGRRKCRPSIFTNRRNPSLCWVSIEDIWLNIKERFYCWWWRVPQGSCIFWGKDGKIKGHSTRAKRPYFK